MAIGIEAETLTVGVSNRVHRGSGVSDIVRGEKMTRRRSRYAHRKKTIGITSRLTVRTKLSSQVPA